MLGVRSFELIFVFAERSDEGLPLAVGQWVVGVDIAEDLAEWGCAEAEVLLEFTDDVLAVRLIGIAHPGCALLFLQEATQPVWLLLLLDLEQGVEEIVGTVLLNLEVEHVLVVGHTVHILHLKN